jgi:multiple sugar transport system ATP-binding protein
MAKIVLDGVTKVFDEDVVAVDDVSLEIRDGEFMVLVGPSGCGKSTLLRIVAGLEELTAGEVSIGDEQVTDLPPKQRDVAMVFQNYALYPHMTVAQNLAFGLRLRKTPREDVQRRVTEVAKILVLEPLLQRKPAALSGGQRQRVAMGRAMVREPQAFLMDEPLSNLDAKLRVQMRAELARLHERLRTTTLYVTHDQIEAMTLGERVAVMRDGVLQQVDVPQNLFHHPVNLFVAAFIGSPPMNLVEARVNGDTVAFAEHELPVAAGTDLSRYDGRSLILGIRPTDLEDHDVIPGDPSRTIEVVADVTEELGSEMNVIFTVDAPVVELEDLVGPVGEEQEELPLLEDRCQFCARVDPRSNAKPGARIRLTVDPSRFHFFDPDTGATIDARQPEAVGAGA